MAGIQIDLSPVAIQMLLTERVPTCMDRLVQRTSGTRLSVRNWVSSGQILVGRRLAGARVRAEWAEPELRLRVHQRTRAWRRILPFSLPIAGYCGRGQDRWLRLPTRCRSSAPSQESCLFSWPRRYLCLYPGAAVGALPVCHVRRNCPSRGSGRPGTGALDAGVLPVGATRGCEGGALTSLSSWLWLSVGVQEGRK